MAVNAGGHFVDIDADDVADEALVRHLVNNVKFTLDNVDMLYF